MSKEYYEIHLRLDQELKEKIEAKMSMLGYGSVNAYISELIMNDVNNKDSQLETISNKLTEIEESQVDISYYQTFVTFCIEMFLAGHGAYEAIEFAINEIDKVFSKSRYKEPVGLEKLDEFTNTVKKIFVERTGKASESKPNSMPSSQQTSKPVKQKTIADLQYNEIMIDPDTKIPYRRVPQNELTKCKNVPRTLLNQYLEAWKTNPNAVFESSKIIVPGSIVGTTHKLYKSDLDGGYIRVMEDK